MRFYRSLIFSFFMTLIFALALFTLTRNVYKISSYFLKATCLYFFFTSAITYLFIKKRKKKNSEDPYEEAMELSEEGFLVLDQKFDIKYVNSSFCGFLGVHEALKGSFYDLNVQKNHELFKEIKLLLKKCFQHKSLSRNRIEIKTPRSKTFECVVTYVEDYGGFVATIKDATKDASTIHMGKEFIANATHELRTPITIIKGFVETLKDLPEISEAMIEDISDKVLRSCHRMDRIVKNLLLLTDLDHLSSAQLKDFNLCMLVENCRHNLLHVNPEAHVEIHSTSHKMVAHADYDLLELALMNLMQNAVKYSPKPANINVYLDAKGNQYHISVSDQGRGIPKEHYETIFDRFATVNKAQSRKLGGVGLGLSIVKAIVEKHNGSISVSSNNEGGALFTMSFPR